MLFYESIVHSFLLLNSILSYGYTTIHLYIELLMDIYTVSHLGLLQIKLSWTFVHKSFYEYTLSFLLSTYE